MTDQPTPECLNELTVGAVGYDAAGVYRCNRAKDHDSMHSDGYKLWRTGQPTPTAPEAAVPATNPTDDNELTDTLAEAITDGMEDSNNRDRWCGCGSIGKAAANVRVIVEAEVAARVDAATRNQDEHIAELTAEAEEQARVLDVRQERLIKLGDDLSAAEARVRELEAELATERDAHAIHRQGAELAARPTPTWEWGIRDASGQVKTGDTVVSLDDSTWTAVRRAAAVPAGPWEAVEDTTPTWEWGVRLPNGEIGFKDGTRTEAWVRQYADEARENGHHGSVVVRRAVGRGSWEAVEDTTPTNKEDEAEELAIALSETIHRTCSCTPEYECLAHVHIGRLRVEIGRPTGTSEEN